MCRGALTPPALANVSTGRQEREEEMSRCSGCEVKTGSKPGHKGVHRQLPGRNRCGLAPCMQAAVQAVACGRPSKQRHAHTAAAAADRTGHAGSTKRMHTALSVACLVQFYSKLAITVRSVQEVQA
jgi:hypothetical protein